MKLLSQTALDCYLAAISAIQEQAVEVTPELTNDHGRTLLALHRNLSAFPSVEELTLSRTALVNALADYRSKAAAFLSKKDEDLRAMLASLAEAAETFSGQTDRQSDGLNKFTQDLQSVASGGDLSHMRRELAKRVAELKVMHNETSRDNSSLVADMHKQLAEFRKRLESTERRAVTDALTGLLNRGEGEARLVAQLERGQPFSVILVDLDDFKQINDHFGHVSGDQVLKTFGHILTHAIGPSDTVCRWGGDEFLVMMTANQLVAEQRVLQLRKRLVTRCKLLILGKMYDVDVKASIGVSETRAGETIGELLARVDTDLYRHKKREKRNGQKAPVNADIPDEHS